MLQHIQMHHGDISQSRTRVCLPNVFAATRVYVPAGQANMYVYCAMPACGHILVSRVVAVAMQHTGGKPAVSNIRIGITDAFPLHNAGHAYARVTLARAHTLWQPVTQP